MKFSEIESVLLLFKSSRIRRESETGDITKETGHLRENEKPPF